MFCIVVAGISVILLSWIICFVRICIRILLSSVVIRIVFLSRLTGFSCSAEVTATSLYAHSSLYPSILLVHLSPFELYLTIVSTLVFRSIYHSITNQLENLKFSAILLLHDFSLEVLCFHDLMQLFDR